MEWKSFSRMLVDAEREHNTILDDLPQYREFLNKSELIISLGPTHFPFKQDPALLDAKSILKLLEESDVNNQFVRLMNTLEELEAEQKKIAGQKRSESQREIMANIEKVKREIKAFPVEALTVHDDIVVQIIYPSVNMKAIQAIKGHRLINQEKTCQCKACIRTILL